MMNVPTIAPAVFAASRRPASEAIRVGSSLSRLEEAGKLRPITNVAGRTTSTAGLRSAHSVSNACEGSSRPGRPMMKTRPPSVMTATTIWLTARKSRGRRIRGRKTAYVVAPRTRPNRKIARIELKM